MPDPYPMSPQQTIAHYRIIAKLGQGGMGEVWRAADTKLNREVAIKILPDTFAADPGRLARFIREAQLLAALNHPNIATIHGVEERALIMELVEGPTLAERIARGQVPLDEALTIARQIAGALDAAHEKGIIHRDLKPANIKITPDGRVKVLDFGLAKDISGDLLSVKSANSCTDTMGETMAGAVLGTPAYMAPEQVQGKQADKRADIWAFGVVLYRMLAGRLPFTGKSMSEILANILKEEPDLSAIPGAARRLIARCLEKDPKRRLRDIGDFADLLDPAPPSPARRSARLPWIAAAAALLASASLAAFMWLRPIPLPEVTRFEIEAPAGSTLPLGTPAPSPNGRILAYTVKSSDGVSRIYLRSLASAESRVLAGTEHAVHPFWSPDGQSLAFSADGNLKRIDVAGGPPRTLAVTPGPWHGDWGRDGVILYANETSIDRIPAEGGAITPTVRLDEKNGESNAGFPFFLSDGKRFLLNTKRLDGGSSIDLGTFGSMERRVVLKGVASAPIVVTAPNGKAYLLYLRDASVMARRFDESSGAVRGNPFVLVEGAGRVARPPVRPTLGVSPAVLAYQTAADVRTAQLEWLDRSGHELSRLPVAAGTEYPRLSPNGRYVAAAGLFSRGWDVAITDLARGSSTRFTFGENGRSYFNAVWSPDGKRIAYSILGGGLFVKNADGTGGEREIAKDGLPMDWSPDGLRILASHAPAISLLPLDGSTPIQVGSDVALTSGAAISPDGKYVAFSSGNSGRLEVYLASLPPLTGKWQVSIAGGTQPRWRRDGKELFFLSPDSKMMAAELSIGEAVISGIPHALFQTPLSPNVSYDVTADGKSFLMPLRDSDATNAPIMVVLNWWAGLNGK